MLAPRLYVFVRLIRRLMRRRHFGVRLIWRLRQRWLFGALRVGRCSCVGWRCFGGFVCVRGQLVEHGIAPEKRVQRRGYIGYIAAATSSAGAGPAPFPTEMMRPTGIARWSQLTIRSSSAPSQATAAPTPHRRRSRRFGRTLGHNCSRPRNLDRCCAHARIAPHVRPTGNNSCCES